MPIYQYECPDCGPFQAQRPMSRWKHPACCPCCGSRSPRTVCAPHIRDGRSTLNFKIEERNERSAYEPKLVQHVGRKNQDLENHGFTKHRNRQTGHSHKHGHGHAGPHRPWMVGH